MRAFLADGNLSVHLKKLEEAKYISVKKNFADRKPITHYKLAASGRKAFEAYYPFDRFDLKHCDPLGYKLVEDL